MSFKLQIVFGLFALCVFHSIPTEAQIKWFYFKKNVSPSISRQQPVLPSTSQMITSYRQPPIHMAARVNSMESINLQPLSSSSSSNIYRSLSGSSLNHPNSPAMMREISTLHRQAATTLNSEILNIVQPHSENTLMQRLMPNTERMSLISKYIKNGAIGLAAAGGFISITNTFASNNNNYREVYNNETVTSPPPTTTTVSEITNRIGVFK